ncbi:MAG: cadherin domain-containing protein [Bacteroidota bacterium]
MMKRSILFASILLVGTALWAQTITTGEYFFDTDPGIGNATSFALTTGTSISENVSVNVDGLSLGFHILGVRIKQADDRWSQTKTSSFYKFAPTSSPERLVAAEYFFDTDPGLGNGTALSITTENTVSSTFTVDASALSTGYHTLTLRVQDDLGQWSVNYTGRFYIINLPVTSDQIIAAEYFFDDDPGLDEGTALTLTAGNELSQTYTVPTEGLSDGFHILTFRTQNELGIWSTNHSGRFFVFSPKLPAKLLSLEYFFDEDPGIGQGQQLQLESLASLDSSFVVSVPDTLSEGTHSLFVRAKDANGIYSFSESRTFQIITDPIVDDFFPKEGGPGTQVSIVGSNFSTVSGENTIKFGEAFATNLIFGSSDSLVAVVPDDASGLVPIEVTVDGNAGVSENLYNVNVAVAEGLIAYYPFNGNADDESGNGNDGTVNGATLTLDRFGEVSSAYSFDGVNDFVLVKDDESLSFNNQDEYSLGMWVLADLDQLDRSEIVNDIISKWSPNFNNGYSLVARYNNNTSENPGSVSFARYGGIGCSGSGVSDSSENGGKFIFYLSTYKDDVLRLYVNGILIDERDIIQCGSVVNTSPLLMGSRNEIGELAFKGLIDDVRIYNRALSFTEIQELSSDRPQEAPVIANQSFSIAENRIVGTAVGTIQASDVNNDTLTFEIISGNTDNTFMLVDSTGALFINDPTTLDFEVNSSFTLEISVSDGIETSQAIVTIAVSDVDESVNQPPQLLADTYVIKENRINGLFIARLTAGDPDGDNISFVILSGNIGNAFFIDDDGNLITNEQSALDFEVNPQFSLLVRVSDGQVNVDETITVILTDVDESINQPPQANNAFFEIDENLPTGSLVGSFLAGDPDGDAISYEIISGNESGTFTISGTGRIEVLDNTLLDFEANSSFELEITVSDGLLTILRDIFIEVKDVDENVVPIVANPISDLTLTEGFATATINIEDVFADVDQDLLTYSTESSAESVVTVSESQGVLTITEVGIGTATISLTANDGNGGSVTETFSIVVEVAPLSIVGQGLSIYPNPSNGYIVVSFDEELVINAVFDLAGNEINYSLSKLPEGNIALDFTSAAPGIYFLEYMAADLENQSIRIVKSD